MLRRSAVGVADHAEQAVLLHHTVHRELGIENFVAAVLAVCLREHHQLHVGGVAAQRSEAGDEVIHFIVGQGQAEFNVGLLQSRAATGQHVHVRHGRSGQFGEQCQRSFRGSKHAFGHAVVQQGSHGGQLSVRQTGFAQQLGFEGELKLGHAFQPAHHQPAVVGNVSCFRGPGRHGTQPGRHHHGH